MWHLNYMVVTYLPCKVVTLCALLGMTIRKNHPNGLKRWNGKFSTMFEGILGRKLLNHYCLPLHDHFGELLVIFAHSTTSWVWFVSCKDHPKLNWVVGCSVLSTHPIYNYKHGVCVFDECLSFFLSVWKEGRMGPSFQSMRLEQFGGMRCWYNLEMQEIH